MVEAGISRGLSNRIGPMGWVVMAALALGVCAVSLRYLVPGMPGAFPSMPMCFVTTPCGSACMWSVGCSRSP